MDDESGLVRLARITRVEAHRRRNSRGDVEQVEAHVRKILDAFGGLNARTRRGAYAERPQIQRSVDAPPRWVPTSGLTSADLPDMMERDSSPVRLPDNPARPDLDYIAFRTGSSGWVMAAPKGSAVGADARQIYRNRSRAASYIRFQIGGQYAGPGKGEFDDGEIQFIGTKPDFRRQGLATEMLARARDLQPNVHHSDSLTEDGRGFVEVTPSRSPLAQEMLLGSEIPWEPINRPRPDYRTQPRPPGRLIESDPTQPDPVLRATQAWEDWLDSQIGFLPYETRRTILEKVAKRFSEGSHTYLDWTRPATIPGTDPQMDGEADFLDLLGVDDLTAALVRAAWRKHRGHRGGSSQGAIARGMDLF